jgi:hypothetical protein
MDVALYDRFTLYRGDRRAVAGYYLRSVQCLLDYRLLVAKKAAS